MEEIKKKVEKICKDKGRLGAKGLGPGARGREPGEGV